MPVVLSHRSATSWHLVMNVCEQKKTHPEGIKHPPVGEVLASPGKPEAVRQAPKSCVATLTRNANGETKSVFKGISARTPPRHLLRKGNVTSDKRSGLGLCCCISSRGL